MSPLFRLKVIYCKHSVVNTYGLPVPLGKGLPHCEVPEDCNRARRQRLADDGFTKGCLTDIEPIYELKCSFVFFVQYRSCDFCCGQLFEAPVSVVSSIGTVLKA